MPNAEKTKKKIRPLEADIDEVLNGRVWVTAVFNDSNRPWDPARTRHPAKKLAPHVH
jgi:hypothetical protein